MEKDTCWPIVRFKRATLTKTEFEDPVDKDTGEVKYRRIKLTLAVDCDIESSKKMGEGFASALYEADGRTLRRDLDNLKAKTELFQVNRITFTDPKEKVDPLTAECWVGSSVKVVLNSGEADPTLTLIVHIPRDHATLCAIHDLKCADAVELDLVRSEAIEENRNAQKSVADRLSDCAESRPHVAAPRVQQTDLVAEENVSFDAFGPPKPRTEEAHAG